MDRHGFTREYGTVLCAFVALNVFSLLWQPTISAKQGLPWDAEFYATMATQFARNELPATNAPFVYRPAVPFLASRLFPDNLPLSFGLVNLLANTITILVLLIWVRKRFHRPGVRILTCLLFMANWAGPVRFLYFFPVLSDYWAYPFLLLGLILIDGTEERPTARVALTVSLCVAVGVFFRESVLLVAVAGLFVSNPIRFERGGFPWVSIKFPPVSFALPLVAGVLTLWLTHRIATTTEEYDFLHHAAWFLYHKPALTYLAAWPMAFGPVLFLAIYDWKRRWAFLRGHQAQLVYLTGIAVLAWVGGNSTERFLLWGAPVVYVLIGHSIEDHYEALKSPMLLLVLVVAQGTSQRWLWHIPEPGVTNEHSYVILTDFAAPFLEIWSMGMKWSRLMLLLVEYGLLCLGLIAWLAWREERRRASVARAEVFSGL